MRLGVLLLLLAIALPAHSQQTASRATFLKLMDVQELWEEDRYPEAIVKLEGLAAATRNKPYDFAVTNQYLAHTAVMMGEPRRARPALEAALAVPGLPDELVGELKMFYAQIVLGDDDFELARRMFDDWLALTDAEPTPVQLFSIGYANYMSDHLDESRDLVARAVTQSANPPDNWLRLYYQILFDSKAYGDARQVALDLVNRDPDSDQFWRLLASHHLRLEEYETALAVSDVALTAGAMNEEPDLRRLASLYGQVLVPEKAARQLERWIDAREVESNARTWRQVGDLWMLAREREPAKAALWKSVSLKPDTAALEFLAGIHFEDAEWQRSYEAFERALSATDPGAGNVHRLQMLTGLTAMRAGHDAEAREFLALARQDDRLRGQVQRILRELEQD